MGLVRGYVAQLASRIASSFGLPPRLRSGLRQSGSRFAPDLRDPRLKALGYLAATATAKAKDVAGMLDSFPPILSEQTTAW
jgi:hypothetical protein